MGEDGGGGGGRQRRQDGVSGWDGKIDDGIGWKRMKGLKGGYDRVREDGMGEEEKRSTDGTGLEMIRWERKS